MALTISVETARRGRSFTIKGKGGQITLRRKLIFNVHLSGLTDYSVVSEPEILAADGIPQVNHTPYQFGGKFIPYLLCTSSKLIETNSLDNWKVECNYDGGIPSQSFFSAPVDPPDDPEDLDPQIERSVELIPLHVIKDIDGDPILTPTGNFYAEPAVKLWPILTLTVKQYENTFTDDDLTSRTMVANLNSFRGDDPYQWRITDVKQEETTIPTTGGDQATNQVHYILQRNTLSDGWRETRALIDTHYLKTAGGKKLPFLDGGQPTTGWLKADGTIQPRSSGLVFAKHKILFETAWPFLSRVDAA